MHQEETLPPAKKQRLFPESQFGISFKFRQNLATCIIKQRYSDFIVNEIMPDGTVARLSNTDPCSVQDSNEYLHFTLYKENRETGDAIKEISRKSRLHHKSFSTAGNKDKRGITTQRVSVQKGDPERISNAFNSQEFNAEKSNGNILTSTKGIIRCGNFEFKDYALKMGDLKGNRFKVTLRDVQFRQDLESNLLRLKKQGFVNYFGMQRFGTSSVPTHQVGVQVLLGNFDAAVQLVMSVRDGDKEQYRVARKHWNEHGDVEKALQLFPRSCLAERAILTCFSKTGKVRHCETAFGKIPKGLRLMYLHAFQSFVWRLEISIDPIIGDLVLDGETLITLDSKNLNSYTIHDIVLPLPGWDVVYPEPLKQAYATTLESLGLDISNMKRKNRDYSLPGGYRKVLGKVGQLEYTFYYYNDATIPLSRSDLDSSEPAACLQEKGKYLGVVVEFDLDSSCYATMALREVGDMKEDEGNGRDCVEELEEEQL